MKLRALRNLWSWRKSSLQLSRSVFRSPYTSSSPAHLRPGHGSHGRATARHIGRSCASRRTGRGLSARHRGFDRFDPVLRLPRPLGFCCSCHHLFLAGTNHHQSNPVPVCRVCLHRGVQLQPFRAPAIPVPACSTSGPPEHDSFARRCRRSGTPASALNRCGRSPSLRRGARRRRFRRLLTSRTLARCCAHSQSVRRASSEGSQSSASSSRWSSLARPPSSGEHAGCLQVADPDVVGLGHGDGVAGVTVVEGEGIEPVDAESSVGVVRRRLFS